MWDHPHHSVGREGPREVQRIHGSIDIEPSYFKEAVHHPVWVDAMVEEYDSIIRNSAWKVVPRTKGKLVVGSKEIYRVKQEADGSVEKHKDNFVAKGFSQVEGTDYDETFSPVSR